MIDQLINYGFCDVMEFSRHEVFVSGPGGSQPIMNPFADPNLWYKIGSDPTTQAYLTDPEYKKKITELQNDPTKLG